MIDSDRSTSDQDSASTNHSLKPKIGSPDPKKKLKGGMVTVSICPSCHCEFHYLEKLKSFQPIEEIRKIIEESITYRDKCAERLGEEMGI